MTIKAIFTGENIFSNAKDAFALYEKSRFGEQKAGKIKYALVEALFLTNKNKAEIYSGNKKLTFDQLLRKCKKIDKKIETKFAVFSDLRERGYIVKTALKFGADLRVYDKGKKPGQAHAKWIVFPVNENQSLTWHEFSSKNRVAHSTKKNLLIAIVDEEGDCTYYQVSWIKP